MSCMAKRSSAASGEKRREMGRRDRAGPGLAKAGWGRASQAVRKGGMGG